MTDAILTVTENFILSSLTDLYRAAQATESHALLMMRVQRGITSWGNRRITDRRTEAFTVFLDAPDNASRITVKTEFVLNAAKTGPDTSNDLVVEAREHSGWDESRNCFTITREICELRLTAGGDNHAATLRQLWKLLHAQAKASLSRNTAGNATWLMF
ncbi:hypothetical protein [Enterobacter soli]|uniref:hypothetical protein n=1 Tax=Enterobacter soli TaxID=885040 RepID=UPI00402A927D